MNSSATEAHSRHLCISSTEHGSCSITVDDGINGCFSIVIPLRHSPVQAQNHLRVYMEPNREDAAKLVPRCCLSQRYSASHQRQRAVTSTSRHTLQLPKGPPFREFHRFRQMMALDFDLSRRHLFQDSSQPQLPSWQNRPGGPRCPGGTSSHSPREENLVSAPWAPPVSAPVPPGGRRGFLQSNQGPALCCSAQLQLRIMKE